MVSKIGEQQSRRHKIIEYWLVKNHTDITANEKRGVGVKTEDYAQKVLLPQLGFDYVLPLNNTMKLFRVGNGKYRKTFIFDFYCEKQGIKWFIDVTCYPKKDVAQSPLWEKLGVKIGILFIRRDLKQYFLKEASGKSQVCLTLNDVGLEHTSHVASAKKMWERRKREGLKKKPMTEETKRRIAESCTPGWNKGLTKETDTRVARGSHPHKLKVQNK